MGELWVFVPVPGLWFLKGSVGGGERSHFHSLPTRVRKSRSLGEADEPQGRQSPGFSQCWEAAAVNKDGRACERRLGKGRGRRKRLSSSQSWDWQRKVRGGERSEMWLKGTQERTECMCAPTQGFALSCVCVRGVFHLGGGENIIVPNLVVRGYL